MKQSILLFCFCPLILPNSGKQLNEKNLIQQIKEESDKNMIQIYEPRIISSAARKKPEVSCDGHTLVIKGAFLKISDIDKSKTCSGKEPKMVKVYATREISIDIDLIWKRSQFLLVIMAPVWRIENRRKIELIGKSADRVKPSKARSGRGYGSRGFHGISGKPGYPSGSFLGLGEVFINGGNLNIVTEGGQGSPGQHGGNGGPGQNGRDAKVPKRFNCYINYIITFVLTPYKCEGEAGKRGGTGGNGGLGGFGGLPGKIKIFELDQKSNIKQFKRRGAYGTPGQKGKGGNGGKYGNDQQGGCTFIFICYNLKNIENNKRASKGYDGLSGRNNKYRKGPDNPTDFDRHISTIVNEYKIYLEDTLEDESQRNTVYRFLIKIFKNKEIFKYYDIVALIDEFLGVEKHFYSLHDKINLTPLYKEIQKHIEQQAKGNNKEDNRKALAYLYTAVLSKFCILQEAANGKFIANLGKFLDSFLKNIKRFKKIKAGTVITNHKNSYKKEIDKEIEEADSLITEHIVPQIEELTLQNEEHINSLFEEILQIKDDVLERQSKLEMKLSDMKFNLFLDAFSGVMNIIGEALKLIGPIGMVAGTAIKGGITILNAVSYDENAKELPPDNSGYKKRIDGIEAFLSDRADKQIRALKQELHEIKSLLTDVPKRKQITDKLEAIGKEMNTWSFKDDIAKKFKEKLSKVQKDVDKMQTKRSLAAVGAKFGKAAINSDLISISLQTYVNCKKDADVIGIIHGELAKCGKQIKKLNDYMKRIQTNLIPLLNDMKIMMDNLYSNLKGKSAVNLEQINLRVQNYLKEVKWMIQDFTENFDVGKGFQYTADAIMDAVNTMVDIFRKIQYFEEEQKLVSHIATVNAASYQKIIVKNTYINDALNQLEMYFQSNVILMCYKQSINQLKLFAFPLAKIYFKEFNLPVMLQQKNTVEKYLHNTINQIELFELKLSEGKVYVTKFDEMKRSTRFYNDSLTGPFFIWEHQQYGDAISKLLAGEEVMFHANANSHQKNAVKFKHIEFRLKSHGDQSELDAVLEGFMGAMTHTGNNYYRCNSKVYLITTNAQRFKFSFKKIDDVNVDKNLVLKKIGEDAMLSPFALWKFQLLSRADGFDRLKRLEHEVDVELVGEGEYYKDGFKVCDDDLEKYYEVYNFSQKIVKKQKVDGGGRKTVQIDETNV